MWNILLAIVLAVHGAIHLLGFVVPWRLAQVEELPYKTTILAGRLDMCGATRFPDGSKVRRGTAACLKGSATSQWTR